MHRWLVRRQHDCTVCMILSIPLSYILAEHNNRRGGGSGIRAVPSVAFDCHTQTQSAKLLCWDRWAGAVDEKLRPFKKTLAHAPSSGRNVRWAAKRGHFLAGDCDVNHVVRLFCVAPDTVSVVRPQTRCYRCSSASIRASRRSVAVSLNGFDVGPIFQTPEVRLIPGRNVAFADYQNECLFWSRFWDPGAHHPTV